MDPAEIRFTERPLLKRVARSFLEKSARSQSCQSPLKLQRHLEPLLEKQESGFKKFTTPLETDSRCVHSTFTNRCV